MEHKTDDQRGDSFAASPNPAIPAIESAVLNIGTAMSDCESARDAWIEAKWNDATMWISNAIAQLESAKAKIYAHHDAESPNDKDHESPEHGGDSK